MRPVLIALALGALAAASPAQDLREQQRREEARKHYRAGEEHMLAEAFEGAEREFKAATDRDPGFVLAYYSLGQARMALKRYAPAVEAYTACKDVDQRRRDEIHDLQVALVRMRMGHFKGARPAGREQLELEQRISVLRDQQMPGHGAHTVPAVVSLGLGSAYFRLGQLEPAEKNYRAAVAVDGKMGEAHNNLAVIYMMTGRLDDADREIKAAEKAGFTVSSQFKQDLKQRSTVKTKP